MGKTRYAASGAHHGWRRPAEAFKRETERRIKNFGPPSQSSVNKGVMTRRNKRTKVTLARNAGEPS